MQTQLHVEIAALWRYTGLYWYLEASDQRAVYFPEPLNDICIEAGVILNSCLQVPYTIGRLYPVEALEQVQGLLDLLGMQRLGKRAKGAVEVIRAQDGEHWIEFRVREPQWGERLLNEINQLCLQYELSK